MSTVSMVEDLGVLAIAAGDQLHLVAILEDAGELAIVAGDQLHLVVMVEHAGVQLTGERNTRLSCSRT